MRSDDVKPAWFAPAILVFLTTTIYLFWLPVIDIRLYDETSYLQAGLSLFETPLDIETAPLYAVWYWLCSLVVHNPANLYYASWCILVALCLALPYAIERSRAAVVYACMACMLPFYLIWPYINFFAGAIVLASLAVIERRQEKSYVSLCAALLLMCCVVALVRPEFHNASYLAVALLIGAIFVEGRIHRHRTILILSVAAFAANEFLFLGLSGSRSGIAFAAYDDWIRFMQGRLSETPRTPWNAYQLFGLTEDATLLDFLKANPAEFWSHVTYNVTQTKSAALLALGALTTAALCIRLTAPGRVAVKIPFDRLIPLAVVYAPAIAAIIIIMPKSHYFIIPYLVSIFYVARSDLVMRAIGSNSAILVTAFLAIAAIFATFFTINRGKPEEYRVVDVIKCVTELQSTHAISRGPVLEAMGGLSTYLRGNTVWLRHYEIKDGESLEAFIARAAPVIIVSDKEFYDYFVQKGNLSAAITREEMNSLIRRSGYENYKCRSPAPDIFFAKNLSTQTH